MAHRFKVLLFTLIIAGCITSAAAEGPVPYTPAHDSRFFTGDEVPLFSWESYFGAYGYFLEFDDSNDWSPSLGGIMVDKIYFDLPEYLTQRDWDPLTFNLYWRVRPVLFNGSLGDPGPTFHFSKTVAEPPETWEPKNETLLKPWSPPVVFSWSPYPNGNAYWMEFSDTIEFTQSFGELEWDSTNLNMIQFISPEDWHYAGFSLFWRMSAQDVHGNKSPWGPSSGFVKLGYRRVVCYGDSITGGYGADDFDSGFGGYPPMLMEKLQNIDEKSSVATRWFSGGKAEDGALSVDEMFSNKFPGVVVCMFGTVDIIDPANCENGDCRTVERLEEIIEKCRENAVVPIICTVIPYNPAGGHPKFPDVSEIQSQLDQLNIQIREFCDIENVAMVDLDQIMRNDAPYGDLSSLYFDWAHPNNAGYEIMSNGIFDVIKYSW